MHGERFLSVNETIAALGIARQATLNARIAAGWLYPEMRNGRRFFLESEVMRVAQFDLLPSEAARKLGMSTKELKAWMVCTDHLAWLQLGTTYYFRSKDVAAVKELLTPYMKMSDATREFAICYDQLNDGVNKGRLQGFSYGYRFTYVLRNEVATFAGAAKRLKATWGSPGPLKSKSPRRGSGVIRYVRRGVSVALPCAGHDSQVQIDLLGSLVVGRVGQVVGGFDDSLTVRRVCDDRVTVELDGQHHSEDVPGHLAGDLMHLPGCASFAARQSHEWVGAADADSSAVAEELGQLGVVFLRCLQAAIAVDQAGAVDDLQGATLAVDELGGEAEVSLHAGAAFIAEPCEQLLGLTEAVGLVPADRQLLEDRDHASSLGE